MREFTQEGRGTNNDIDTVDTYGHMLTGGWVCHRGRRTSLDGYPGIIHMAADVRQNLSLQAELADRLAIWDAINTTQRCVYSMTYRPEIARRQRDW